MDVPKENAGVPVRSPFNKFFFYQHRAVHRFEYPAMIVMHRRKPSKSRILTWEVFKQKTRVAVTFPVEHLQRFDELFFGMDRAFLDQLIDETWWISHHERF